MRCCDRRRRRRCRSRNDIFSSDMDWLIWQLADSAFPTGGFAHSFGLEAAWQHGEVDGGSLPQYVRHAILQAGRGALPFFTAAHQRPGDLEAIDARCDAFLRHVVANRASRVQGRAWIATIERAFPRPPVLAVCDRARARLECLHHAVDLPPAQRLFLFGCCRSVLSAGVRLGIIGTGEAQRLMAELSVDLDRT